MQTKRRWQHLPEEAGPPATHRSWDWQTKRLQVALARLVAAVEGAEPVTPAHAEAVRVLKMVGEEPYEEPLKVRSTTTTIDGRRKG